MVSQYQGENIVWWSFTEAMKHEPREEVINQIHHPMSLALACFPNNKSWLSQQLNCLSICRVFVFNFNKVSTRHSCIMRVSHMERSCWRYRKVMCSHVMRVINAVFTCSNTTVYRERLHLRLFLRPVFPHKSIPGLLTTDGVIGCWWPWGGDQSSVE